MNKIKKKAIIISAVSIILGIYCFLLIQINDKLFIPIMIAILFVVIFAWIKEHQKNIGDDNMKNNMDLVQIVTRTAILLCVIALIVIGCIIIHGCYISDKCETNIYTGSISDINSNSIILENNKVIFAYNIQNFEWELGTRYEITVKSFFTDKEIIGIKILEKQEKTTNDRTKETRTL